jgi:predicted CopG family antitoxin
LEESRGEGIGSHGADTAHICAYRYNPIMTKVISLSEKAYSTPKKLKRGNESFSDLVLRMAGQSERKSLLEFEGSWRGDDIEAVFAKVMKDREQGASRRIEV